MSVDFAFDLMKNYPPSMAASKKLGHVPEDFAWYDFEMVMEKGRSTGLMRVKGCQFRKALKGPNKGKPSIALPKTSRTLVISKSEISEFSNKI